MDNDADEFNCAVCQGDQFSRTDMGDIVCDLCGTQSQAFGEEAELDVNLMARAFGHGIVQRRRKSMAPSAIPKKKSDVQLEWCLTGFQHILHHQTRLLVDLSLCSPRLVGVVEDLWFRFLEKRLSGQSSVKWLHDSFVTPMALSKRKFQNEEDTTGSHFSVVMADRRIAMSFSVVFCYLGCRWLKEPIMACDFASWVLNGTLPYFGAFQLMPRGLRDLLVLVRSFFQPLQPLSSNRILELTGNLASFLEMPLPVPNVSALLHRLIPTLSIPTPFEGECLNDALRYVRHLDLTSEVLRRKESGTESSTRDRNHVRGQVKIPILCLSRWLKSPFVCAPTAKRRRTGELSSDSVMPFAHQKSASSLPNLQLKESGRGSSWMNALSGGRTRGCSDWSVPTMALLLCAVVKAVSA